jgi:DNA-binding response OmpR family regulator
MKRILILEDDREILNIFKIIFCDEGYLVVGLLNDDELNDYLASFNPHLIILDIKLAGVDGLTLAKQLKSDPLYSHIPIILTTAGLIDQKSLEGCCEGFISKPFDIEEVLELAHSIIWK